jgi:hypothetical protein
MRAVPAGGEPSRFYLQIRIGQPSRPKINASARQIRSKTLALARALLLSSVALRTKKKDRPKAVQV